jgi:hypothetical protein
MSRQSLRDPRVWVVILFLLGGLFALLGDPACTPGSGGVYATGGDYCAPATE